MKGVLVKLKDWLPPSEAELEAQREAKRAEWDAQAWGIRNWAKSTSSPYATGDNHWINKMITRSYSEGPIQVYNRCLHIAIAELIDYQRSRD